MPLQYYGPWGYPHLCHFLAPSCNDSPSQLVTVNFVDRPSAASSCTMPQRPMCHCDGTLLEFSLTSALLHWKIKSHHRCQCVIVLHGTERAVLWYCEGCEVLDCHAAPFAMHCADLHHTHSTYSCTLRAATGCLRGKCHMERCMIDVCGGAQIH